MKRTKLCTIGIALIMTTGCSGNSCTKVQLPGMTTLAIGCYDEEGRPVSTNPSNDTSQITSPPTSIERGVVVKPSPGTTSTVTIETKTTNPTTTTEPPVPGS